MGFHSEGIFHNRVSAFSNYRSASTVVFVRPIAVFFATTRAGLSLWVVLMITPLIIMCPLYYYHQKHPVNYLLLGIFTVTLAFAVGLTCVFTSRKVMLESAILTTVLVLSLTFYTFWEARKGYDFNFLSPFLFGALIVFLVFALIQGNTLACITFECKQATIEWYEFRN